MATRARHQPDQQLDQQSGQQSVQRPGQQSVQGPDLQAAKQADLPAGQPARARRRPAGEIAEAAWSRFTALDHRIVTWLRRAALPALRISLGVVFVWFGALKLADATPVADLVGAVVSWVDPAWFVPALGAFEVLVGAGLIAGRGLRLVLLLFAAQMLGTFLVLLIRPEVAFQGGNPLLLTTEGEFVVKNLVLLSAGLALGARLRPARPW